MHREVSLAVEIGVVLIAMAAMIGIIWFTVFLGRGVANDASFAASDIMSKTAVATLESIESKCTYPATDSFIALCNSGTFNGKSKYYLKNSNYTDFKTNTTNYKGVEMPIAAVNSILIQNGDSIPYFVCCFDNCNYAKTSGSTTVSHWVENLSEDSSCLLTHLGQNVGASKVELIVCKEASGNYFVIMRPIV